MKTNSARFGQSKIGTTMVIYGHSEDNADEVAAIKFDHLFHHKKKEKHKSNK